MQAAIAGTNAVHDHQQQHRQRIGYKRPGNWAIATKLCRALVLAIAPWLAMSLELGTAFAQSSSSDSAAVAAPAKGIELKGRVLNAEGKPIPIVTVGITELRRGTLTDDEGRYVIPSLPPGVYHISFSRVGYAPVVEHYVLNATTTTLDVTLKESLVELPEVQVTASASATTPLTSPQPTSVLAGETLRQAQAPTLGGMLEQVPGLRSWSSGSGIGKPTIRGMRSDRVVIASHELRLDNQQWGDEHGPQVEIAEIERLEVIRGPASVLYGSDALGGVVNVIPRKLPVAFDRSPFVSGRAFGGFGSVDKNGEGGLSLEGAVQGFGFRGSFTGRQSDDVETPEGKLFNSGNESKTATGSAGVRGAKGSVDLSYTRREERVEIHEDPAEDPTATPYQEIDDDLWRLSGILPVGSVSRLEVNLGAGQNRRSEFESEDDADVALGLLAKTYGGVAHFQHPQIGALEGMLGVSYQHNRFTKFGEESLIPASTGDNAAIFALEETEFGRWRLSLGARYDYRTLDVEEDADLDVAAQTRNWDAASGNAGVLYRVSEPVALVANIGRGFRAPSSADLFSNGVHEGTVAFEKGNPNLAVETSLNIDVALRAQTSRVSAEVGGFINDIQDFIYTRPTGEIDPESGFEIFETAQGNAQLVGYEASAEIHPAREIHISVSSDFVRGDNTDTDTPLPWISPVRALYGARYEPDSLGWAESAYIGIRGESVAEQTRLDPFDTTVPPYTLAHADAGLTVPIEAHPLALDVGVHNLFDKSYRDFMSRFKTYALAPGRNITVRLTMHF